MMRTPTTPHSKEPMGDEPELERALVEVPRGALALAGIATALLLIAWFAIYVFVFLPRGTVN
jgi:hypothetical protein